MKLNINKKPVHGDKILKILKMIHLLHFCFSIGMGGRDVGNGENFSFGHGSLFVYSQ